MTAPRHQPGPIPTSRQFVFALGDHTVNTALSALSLVFFFFLTTVAGLEPWRAGALVWIARIVDAVSDPMMGRISDHTRWAWGRRRPWFLIGAVPFGVSYALLWQTPFETQTGMMLYYLAAYVGLSLAMTVVSVPYMALIPEWSRDFDERTSLNTMRSALSVAGTMVAATIPALAEALGDDARAFGRLGIAVGVWLTLPWLAVFRVSEEPRRDTVPLDAPPLAESLRTLSRHGTYLRLCGFYLCSRVTVDLLGLAFPLYMTEWLGRKSDISGVLLTMLVVVVVSLPFWFRVSLHTDKHRVFVFGAGWFALMLCLLGAAQPGWPRWMLFVAAGLLGVGYAISDLMPWAMLGEVIDEDELRTGERREGLYTGVFTFLRKAGGASAYALAGFALSAAGYDADAGSSPEAKQVIRLITSLVPAFFLALAVLLAFRYPLSRLRHAEIRRVLDARRHPPASVLPPPRSTVID